MVAKKFGIQHAKVVKVIENLIERLRVIQSHPKVQEFTKETYGLFQGGQMNEAQKYLLKIKIADTVINKDEKDYEKLVYMSDIMMGFAEQEIQSLVKLIRGNGDIDKEDFDRIMKATESIESKIKQRKFKGEK